ncbi:unnamed protein product, partial [Effrenium voratum]
LSLTRLATGLRTGQRLCLQAGRELGAVCALEEGGLPEAMRGLGGRLSPRQHQGHALELPQHQMLLAGLVRERCQMCPTRGRRVGPVHHVPHQKQLCCTVAELLFDTLK